MMRIFVLNVGRSGSMSVAREYGLLHEPDGPNPNPTSAKRRAKGRLIYGETSHFWKTRLEELLQAFPKADFVHLVRNGRDVVSSFRTRIFYSGKSVHPYQQKPLPIRGFSRMSRFQRLCHYWRYHNRRIETWLASDWNGKQRPLVRLEDLRLSFRENRGAPHCPWTAAEDKQFGAICGKMMRRYGYR